MELTTKDCIKRAILNTQELVRDFVSYTEKTEVDEVKEMFKEFAEAQGKQAARLQEVLKKLS